MEVEKLSKKIYDYLLENDILEFFIVGEAKDEVVIYERKRTAMAKFWKKKIITKFQRWKKDIRFAYIGKIVIGNG